MFNYAIPRTSSGENYVSNNKNLTQGDCVCVGRVSLRQKSFHQDLHNCKPIKGHLVADFYRPNT